MKKVAFITGASSGIGEALAHEMVSRDIIVVLLARRAERMRATVEAILAKGGQAYAIACDVNQEADLKKAVDETLKKFGRIDYAFANAGFGVAGELEDLTVQDFERQFETNVMGVLKTAYAVLPALKESRGNFSINGSVMSYLTLAGSTPYSMSKYAVRSLAEGLYFEWKKYGISVTLVCPGFVQTEIRQVDNQGKHKPDRRTGWSRLHVPVEGAAKEIANALIKNRREVHITGHGKVIIFFVRFFAPLFRLAALYGLKGRSKVQDFAK